MKVLVIGDEHTYGYGLSKGELSYLGHFIRQISRTGQAVSVEVYAHLTMSQLSSALAQLPLNRYDLIILQVDNNLLQPLRAASVNEPQAAIPVILPRSFVTTEQATRPRALRKAKIVGSALLSMLWPLNTLTGIRALLKQLRPYRHNVLLLTPFPQRELIRRWLQKRSRAVLLNEADKHVFSVFDSDSVIKPREEYFLPNDPEHLSAISHELLGRVLFDFYQSAPTIVTIQSGRRE